jgi:MoaA/NifB/PqqE/SkfB family radical SAM enzyme
MLRRGDGGAVSLPLDRSESPAASISAAAASSNSSPVRAAAAQDQQGALATSAGPSLSPVLSSLPILILYPHSRCNCRCVMCDIWKVTHAEEISPAALEGHLADMRALAVRWVVFSGGEPLMHSDLFRLTALLRGSGIRTTILTTGLLLSENAGRIAEGVDEVIVSLDGPPAVHDRIRRVAGAYARLAEGVRALRRQNAGYPVSARCTVQRDNHVELRRTVATALELGLDSISFLAADLSSTAFNRPEGWPLEQQARVGLTAAQADALEAEVEGLLREFPSELAAGFVREDEAKLRRLVRHFRAHLGLEQARSPRCNAPWVSAVVESDGTVRPCFFHAPYGRLQGQTLREVLNGPAAVGFRNKLDVASNEVCRRCVCSLYRP